MQSSRASTRRVVPAAFLLFAAALLVVGPAEASRTTTDLRSILASSSHELASTSLELPSLELPPLVSLSLDDFSEPIAPVESESRFGFAEDLSLLDVEARPCGFELLGGVGTSRCELTYARNNPLKYVDPDGNAAETFVDVAMAAISIKQAVSSPTFWNVAGAVLDVGAVLVPFVPAVGGRVIDAVQAGNRLADTTSAGRLALVPDFRDTHKAFEHYAKHAKGVELGPKGSAVPKAGGPDTPEFRSFAEYRNAARAFFSGKGPGVLEAVRRDGCTIRFDTKTGLFGVLEKDGKTIRTYFRPETGMQYFRNELKK